MPQDCASPGDPSSSHGPHYWVWRTRHDLLDVRRPRLQSRRLLGLELVPLVHADDPAERATYVVQNLLDGREIDPKHRHARRSRPAKVVQAPLRDPGIVPPRLASGKLEHSLVQPPLRL